MSSDAEISPEVGSAVTAFQARFARDPEFISIAPGRVNLIGEHTDYNDGLVLPMAIDRRVVLAAGRPAHNRSRLVSLAMNPHVECDLTNPVPLPGSWANGILGVVAQTIAAGEMVEQLDVLVQSSIPSGSGLASSAAIEVAMVRLFDCINGTQTPALRAARRCQRAEHEFVGTPCGVMDMLVSLTAVPGHAMLIDCEASTVEAIAMPDPSDAVIVVMETGVVHELARSAYGKRRLTCEEAASVLGVPSLRHAMLTDIDRSRLSATARDRAIHVVAEINRTRTAVAMLRQRNLNEFGDLMNASHRSLQERFDVSCDELDCLVDTANEIGRAGGVFGARMTGGGFGGCAIGCCMPTAVDALRSAAVSAFEQRFGRVPDVWIANSAGPAIAFRYGGSS